MTRLAELCALLASRQSRREDHSPICSCQDCDHAQYALEQAAVNALPALLDVAEAAQKKTASCTFCGGTGIFRVGITDTAYDTDCPACAPIHAALAALAKPIAGTDGNADV